MINTVLACSDFAIEKGHKECIEFLKSPQKAFDTAKKKNNETKVHTKKNCD